MQTMACFMGGGQEDECWCLNTWQLTTVIYDRDYQGHVSSVAAAVPVTNTCNYWHPNTSSIPVTEKNDTSCSHSWDHCFHTSGDLQRSMNNIVSFFCIKESQKECTIRLLYSSLPPDLNFMDDMNSLSWCGAREVNIVFLHSEGPAKTTFFPALLPYDNVFFLRFVSR